MMQIPPGGWAAFSQMTPASRIALGQSTGKRSGGRRRRRKSKAKASRKTRRARKTSGKRKMKFGSPAWQKKYKVGKYRK